MSGVLSKKKQVQVHLFGQAKPVDMSELMTTLANDPYGIQQ
jgi:hypothetical protein